MEERESGNSTEELAAARTIFASAGFPNVCDAQSIEVVVQGVVPLLPAEVVEYLRDPRLLASVLVHPGEAVPLEGGWTQVESSAGGWPVLVGPLVDDRKGRLRAVVVRVPLAVIREVIEAATTSPPEHGQGLERIELHGETHPRPGGSNLTLRMHHASLRSIGPSSTLDRWLNGLIDRLATRALRRRMRRLPAGMRGATSW